MILPTAVTERTVYAPPLVALQFAMVRGEVVRYLPYFMV
jgi:hypothetical protein